MSLKTREGERIKTYRVWAVEREGTLGSVGDDRADDGHAGLKDDDERHHEPLDNAGRCPTQNENVESLGCDGEVPKSVAGAL